MIVTKQRMLVVSIHAPVWVRPQTAVALINSVPFQFTHPCGCDRLVYSMNREQLVSIHAPVWVRPDFTEVLRRWGGFNSRTRVGATAHIFPQLACRIVSIHAPVWVRPVQRRNSGSKTAFQFTHPCGCDPSWIFFTIGSICFNSRTRVGATVLFQRFTKLVKVSIHAPVWVRPDTLRLCNHLCRVSIHAPVWVRH